MGRKDEKAIHSPVRMYTYLHGSDQPAGSSSFTYTRSLLD